MNNKTINLDATAALYRAWMDEAIDCDIRGNPIKRRTAYGALDAMTGEVAFAAGYAAAPQVSTGPGSAAWRLNLLMRELEKRFPHPNPLDSTKTPEQYALESIDRMIAAGGDLYEAVGAYRKPAQGYFTDALLSAGEEWLQAARTPASPAPLPGRL